MVVSAVMVVRVVRVVIVVMGMGWLCVWYDG